jgi:hypothetical protein
MRLPRVRGSNTTDRRPDFSRSAAGLTTTSTSCPSTVRNSINLPTDTETGLQRIRAEICSCVVLQQFRGFGLSQMARL